MTAPATPADVRVHAMAAARGLHLGRLSDAAMASDGLSLLPGDARYLVIDPARPEDRDRNRIVFGPATLAGCERWLDTP